MRFRHSLTVLIALLALGCQAHPNTPSPMAPATLSIQAGQSATAGGLTVKFIGVSNDSRCPIDALCITNGDATTQFEFRTSNATATQELQVANPNTRRTTYRGYAIEVQELAPYPSSARRIDPGDYRVTIKISVP